MVGPDAPPGGVQALHDDAHRVVRIVFVQRRSPGQGGAALLHHRRAGVVAGRAGTGIEGRGLGMLLLRDGEAIDRLRLVLLGCGRIGHERGDVDRDGAHVFVGHLRERARHAGHRSGSCGVMRCEAGAQIGEQLVGRPGPHCRRMRVEGRRVPALGPGAVIGARDVLGAEAIARRVAAGAMAEPLDQHAAAIPLAGLRDASAGSGPSFR